MPKQSPAQIRIQETLLNALQTKNINQVTVSQLCAEAKCARSTFYLYYDSVYAVLQEIEDEYLEEFSSRLPTIATSTIPQSTWVANVKFNKSNSKTLKALSANDPSFQKKRSRILEEAFFRFAGYPADSPVYKFALAIITGATHGITQAVSNYDQSLSTEEMLPILNIFQEWILSAFVTVVRDVNLEKSPNSTGNESL